MVIEGQIASPPVLALEEHARGINEIEGKVSRPGSGCCWGGQVRAGGQGGPDLVRLYEPGWSVRQVAEKFGYSYGVTRRILMRHTVLRSKGGRAESRQAHTRA